MTDEYFVKDKKLAPYLLAASFNGLITYTGVSIQNGELSLKFRTSDQALSLINSFETRLSPHIPANDIFDAIEFFWKKVSTIRNSEMKHYEKQNYKNLL